MAVDVSELMFDSDFTDEYFIIRTKIKIVKGEQETVSEERIRKVRPVQQADDKEIKALDIGDLSKQVYTFFDTEPFQPTSDEYLADEFEYRGRRFKFHKQSTWGNNGYYRGYGVEEV